jgi:hypothetical protein
MRIILGVASSAKMTSLRLKLKLTRLACHPTKNKKLKAEELTYLSLG